MTYKIGSYIKYNSWIIKILDISGYYREYPMYKIERICDKRGFGPHKSVRFPKHPRMIVANIPIVNEIPKVKRNWLWDKKGKK